VASDRSIELRPARPDDLPAVLALLEAAHLPPWDTEEHLHNFVVAEQDGSIVGCGGFEAYPAGNVALVRSMAVDESLRGSGLGGRILEWVMERAGSLGMSEFYLFTMTARDFYLKFDFVDVTLDEIPEAAQEATQYKMARQFGSQFPQLVAMKKL
jgi:amino-acid N-acetyltransferase